MKYFVNDNGVNRPATPEEAKRIEAELAAPPLEKSETDRIAELEAHLSSMAAAYQEGVQSA